MFLEGLCGLIHAESEIESLAQHRTACIARPRATDLRSAAVVSETCTEPGFSGCPYWGTFLRSNQARSEVAMSCGRERRAHVACVMQY